MSPSPGAVLPGTLELLILRSLSTGELHGLGVARRIAQMTHETVDVKAGSLFPALHRMERSGWVKSVWDESENRRRARFYRLTAKGREHLEKETEHWRLIVAGLANALEMP